MLKESRQRGLGGESSRAPAYGKTEPASKVCVADRCADAESPYAQADEVSSDGPPADEDAVLEESIGIVKEPLDPRKSACHYCFESG